MRVRPNASLVWVLGAAFAVTGCQSFNADWQAAREQGSGPIGIGGAWIGTWQNTNNSHCDRMRAILTPVGESELQARFHAKYRKILSFRTSATFQGQREADAFVFHGQQDLGALAGGLYRYEGRVNATNFFCTYQSKYDSGTFTLHRP